MKSLLRKMLGKASLSYESLTTILCDAEAIINSRPLTYVHEDPNDLKPLSPSVFLHEIREVGVSDCDMLCSSKLNKKLKHRQDILKGLRARFRTEYLGQLVLKNGKRETREVNIGDVVLVGDDIHKRIDWPLARVTDTIPGRDGKCRVFVLKIKNGTLKRPIQRIFPLEISEKFGEVTKNLREKAKLFDVIDKCTDSDNKENKDCTSTGDESNVIVTRNGRISRKPQRFK